MIGGERYPGESLWTRSCICFWIARRPLESLNSGPNIPYSSKSIVESIPPTYLYQPPIVLREYRIIVSKGSTRPSGAVKSIFTV